MEEKKKYTNPQIETIMVESCDVVATSETGTETDPTEEPNQNDSENYSS
ncbi:MAG: hypothetical protein KBT35_01525 [Firmicutes bacterium]|nr:hypothetical protein [Candidatus Colivicinus equi]